MSFRIVWRRLAKKQLAAVWLNTPNRRAEITAAAHRVEQRLRRDPLSAGESRGGNLRLVFDGPIGVLFEVDRQAQVVRVISLGPAGPP